MGCMLGLPRKNKRHAASAVVINNAANIPIDVWFNGGGPVARVAALSTATIGAPAWGGPAEGGTWRVTSTPAEGMLLVLVDSARLNGSQLMIPSCTVNLSEMKIIVALQRSFRERYMAKLAAQKRELAARRLQNAKTIQRYARGRLARVRLPCIICLDEFPLPALRRCKMQRAHHTCVPCLTKYVDSQLLDGRLHVRCPGAGCLYLLDNITALASRDALKAHEERLCAKHTDRLLGESDESFLAFCREEARRCPTCGVLIWRCGGCDHMRCACGAPFDWRDNRARILVGATPPHDDGSGQASKSGKEVAEQLPPRKKTWWMRRGGA